MQTITFIFTFVKLHPGNLSTTASDMAIHSVRVQIGNGNSYISGYFFEFFSTQNGEENIQMCRVISTNGLFDIMTLRSNVFIEKSGVTTVADDDDMTLINAFRNNSVIYMHQTLPQAEPK